MMLKQIGEQYNDNWLMLKDVLAFIDHLSAKYRISDEECQVLRDNLAGRESRLNAAADVLIEKYPSLKFQGYDSSMIINEAIKRCFKMKHAD